MIVPIALMFIHISFSPPVVSFSCIAPCPALTPPCLAPLRCRCAAHLQRHLQQLETALEQPGPQALRLLRGHGDTVERPCPGAEDQRLRNRAFRGQLREFSNISRRGHCSHCRGSRRLNPQRHHDYQ